jgi:hypothetical protein
VQDGRYAGLIKQELGGLPTHYVGAAYIGEMKRIARVGVALAVVALLSLEPWGREPTPTPPTTSPLTLNGEPSPTCRKFEALAMTSCDDGVAGFWGVIRDAQ